MTSDAAFQGPLVDENTADAGLAASAFERANEAFLSSERRLSLAVDAAQMGIFDWDLEAGNLAWSHHHLRLFGLTPEQFDGTYEAFEQRLHSDDRARIRAKLARSLADGKEFRDEYRVVWPEGSEHWMEARARVFHNEQGRAQRMMGTVVDISQRKAAENAARIRETELAHLSRVATMGQMASGLAHELNQPLSASLGYASLCLDQIESQNLSPATLTSALREVISEIRRAGAIISRMRAFVDNQQAQNVPLDMNELVRESVKMMEFKLQPLKIRPELLLGDSLPNVLGDTVQIEQVIVNLLFNGVEAMAGNDPALNMLTVTTDIHDGGRSVQVEVVDSGFGIQPENLKRLFEPFFTTKSKGLGMGLNISRSIVDRLGGRLWAVANQERGMRFGFSIPTAKGTNT